MLTATAFNHERMNVCKEYAGHFVRDSITQYYDKPYDPF